MGSERIRSGEGTTQHTCSTSVPPCLRVPRVPRVLRVLRVGNQSRGARPDRAGTGELANPHDFPKPRLRSMRPVFRRLKTSGTRAWRRLSIPLRRHRRGFRGLRGCPTSSEVGTGSVGMAARNPHKFPKTLFLALREIVWVREIVCAHTIGARRGLGFSHGARGGHGGTPDRQVSPGRTSPAPIRSEATRSFGARTRADGDPVGGMAAGNGCFEAPSVVSVVSVFSV